jgi:purine-binding chemotaxis protein CheW
MNLKDMMDIDNQDTEEYIQENENFEKNIGVISFYSGNEYLGLYLEDVREIINDYEITPLYRVPDFLKGVANIRGQIKPVVDLKNILQIQSELPDLNKLKTNSKILGLGNEQNKRNGLLIIDNNIEILLMVDVIEKVLWLSEDELLELPDTVDDNIRKYTKNLVYTNSKPLTIISAKKIINDEIWEQFKSEEE